MNRWKNNHWPKNIIVIHSCILHLRETIHLPLFPFLILILLCIRQYNCYEYIHSFYTHSFVWRRNGNDHSYAKATSIRHEIMNNHWHEDGFANTIFMTEQDLQPLGNTVRIAYRYKYRHQWLEKDQRQNEHTYKQNKKWRLKAKLEHTWEMDGDVTLKDEVKKWNYIRETAVFIWFLYDIPATMYDIRHTT
jgi:hypothetical protein